MVEVPLVEDEDEEVDFSDYEYIHCIPIHAHHIIILYPRPSMSQ